VKLSSALRCLLPILAIVGFVITPMAAPAAVGVVAPAQMTAMADDMPCCPHEKAPMPDCSKACPLMALCMAKCFQNLPLVGTPISVSPVLGDVLIPADDALGPSLAQRPPPRPPRT